MAADYDGYVRVSRVGGRSGESFISPDVQRQQIEGWAAMRGTRIGVWHEDLDQSGGKAERPGLLQAIARVEAGYSAGIVVAKLDRFSRSLPQALEAINRINQAGGEVVSISEGIDPTTPAGKLMLRLILSIAEWQLDVTRENWRVARQRAVERGVHVASRTPTGYTRDARGVLVPHEKDAPAIAALFQARAQGASWSQLARLLNTAGVVGPYKAEQWTPRAMSHILANRVYLGEARSGEYTHADAHPGLVDQATWDAAQRAISAPAQRGMQPALLAGLLRCAGCRHILKPDTMRLRDGSKARIYRCRGQHASGTCTSRVAIMGRIVEPWVEDRFLAALGSHVARADQSTSGLQAAMVELERAEVELAAFRDDTRIISALGVDRFVEGLETRAAAIDAARITIADERASTQPPSLPPVVDLADLWPTLEVGDKQRALRSMIDAIVLRGGSVPVSDRALILWRGEMPDDFPRRGRRVSLEPFIWPHDAPVDPGVLGGEDAEEHPV